MPTPGRYLESLVTYIQRRLVPEGAVIRSPERFYRGAKQIGEIDITIRDAEGANWSSKPGSRPGLGGRPRVTVVLHLPEFKGSGTGE